ncbi:FAD-dependent oxidoreductase [Gorillibacterium sp. sgz5001074]|uniref:FAD-dependent oxidoreductase n=1 Tax=Gorillibacterium sp. sgz5001074 TaxID=3446695 RepID=UPI003F67F9B9
MNRPLSASARSDILDDLESATFDLLIIGGGITGAGIAWDAAKRGMKTVLIEQNDFAFGTSSRSTKLIHGGLRYLKKGEVKLVREVGREREWLYRHAPHMVTPMQMLLPIYKGGTFGYWSSSFGLWLYDRLAGVRKSERRTMADADEAVRMEPLLKREGLKGAGRYYEYRSDDARLTVEVLKTAVRHGAWAVNYVEAEEFFYFRSKVAGVRAVDRLTGREVEIRARKIVNATGPWVDLLRAKDHALKGKRVLLTKGVHLVVDHSKVPVRQAAYFDVPDGRMIFVVPRDGKTYIGTTDTVYNGDPGEPRTTEADRDYLLQAVKTAFPHVKVGPGDVEAMWAGLRPLIREEGKKPSDISRKDEIWESPSGLITIAGGKLTGFRKMAEKTVDVVASSLAQEGRQAFGPCTTAKEALSGGDSGRCETYEELRDQLVRLGVKKGLSIKTAAYLVKQYGSNTADIYMRLEGMDQRFEELVKLRLAESGTEETGESEQAGAEAVPEAPSAGLPGEPKAVSGTPSVGRDGTSGEPSLGRDGMSGAQRAETVPGAPRAMRDGMSGAQRAEIVPGAPSVGRDGMSGAQRAETVPGAPSVGRDGVPVAGNDDERGFSESLEIVNEIDGYEGGVESDRGAADAMDADADPEAGADTGASGAGDMAEEGGSQAGAVARDEPGAASAREPGLAETGSSEAPSQASASASAAGELPPHSSRSVPESPAAARTAQEQVLRSGVRPEPVNRPRTEPDRRTPARPVHQPTGRREPAYPSGMSRPSPSPAIRTGRTVPVETVSPEMEYRALVAEVLYGIEEEMVLNADDFLVRRTGLLYFDRERAETIALDVIDIMAERLSWSEREILNQKLRLSKEWEAATVAAGKD